MDLSKLSRILMAIGGAGIVVSLVWAASVTLTFLSAVSWAHQTFPVIFVRVLSTWPDEGFESYDFNPTIFWVSAALLAAGFVMKLSLKKEMVGIAPSEEKPREETPPRPPNEEIHYMGSLNPRLVFWVAGGLLIAISLYYWFWLCKSILNFQEASQPSQRMIDSTHHAEVYFASFGTAFTLAGAVLAFLGSKIRRVSGQGRMSPLGKREYDTGNMNPRLVLWIAGGLLIAASFYYWYNCLQSVDLLNTVTRLHEPQSVIDNLHHFEVHFASLGAVLVIAGAVIVFFGLKIRRSRVAVPATGTGT